MRQLASIQVVKNITKLVDKNDFPADNIELVTVLGWKCIAKKDEFKAGDKAVYIEIDSILPEREPFMFLATKKFRIKTWKLNKFREEHGIAGAVSQGILFPLTILPAGTYREGEDVTDLIGVTKYESEPEEVFDLEKEFNKKKRNPVLKFLMKYETFRKIYMKFFFEKKEKNVFPKFISKTDETRIQNLVAKLHSEWGETLGWDVTEKVEGQSATYFSRKKSKKGFFSSDDSSREFGVCSRSIWLKTKHACNWWNVAIENDIEEKLSMVPFDVAIQGEVAGPGVQGNIYNFPKLKLFIFNVKNLETGEYYTYEQITAFCQYYGFEQVPLVARNFSLPKAVDDLVNYSNGKSLLADTLREGIVIRKGNISFKVVSPDYLLKWGK